MHRSRPTVLVIFAVVAACSTHDDTDRGTDLLAQDRTLVARLENDRAAPQAPLPAACGSVAIATKPVEANQTQARKLTLQAQGEEMKGNIAEARTLLLRASTLDGTNQSAAYHLGRTNEALGDRSAAMAAYCRYLALTPSSAESAEARQRVNGLSKPVTRVSSGSVSESASNAVRRPVAATRTATRTATRARRTVARTTTPRATVVQSAVATSPARADEASRSSDPVSTPREVGDASAGSVAESGVGSAIDPVQTVEAPTPPRAERRGPTRTQGAIVGAGIGAIIGAATGRSVKGAVIGAATGGLLGTVVTGRGSRLMGPSIR